MTHPARFALILFAACALPACKTVNTGLEKVMGVFKGGPPAAGEADSPPPDNASAASLPDPAPGRNYNTAVMYVDLGGSRRKVVIELDPHLAPKTVANFKKLAAGGYYTGLAFHRAIRGYLVQTGDPSSRTDDKRAEWGTADVGYKLPPEIKGTHVKGAVAMARSNAAITAGDKQSSGSQFFIMLRTASKLDGNYTVFGHVTQGLDALETLSGMSVDTNDCPTKRYEIKSLRLVPPGSPELKPDPAPRRKTKPDYEKGAFEKLLDRVW